MNKRNFNKLNPKPGRPRGELTLRISKLKVNQVVTIPFKDWILKTKPSTLLTHLRKYGMQFSTRKTNKGWAIMRIK